MYNYLFYVDNDESLEVLKLLEKSNLLHVFNKVIKVRKNLKIPLQPGTHIPCIISDLNTNIYQGYSQIKLWIQNIQRILAISQEKKPESRADNKNIVSFDPVNKDRSIKVSGNFDASKVDITKINSFNDENFISFDPSKKDRSIKVDKNFDPDEESRKRRKEFGL